MNQCVVDAQIILEVFDQYLQVRGLPSMEHAHAKDQTQISLFKLTFPRPRLLHIPAKRFISTRIVKSTKTVILSFAYEPRIRPRIQTKGLDYSVTTEKRFRRSQH